jgi:hypothetical protein
MLEHAKKKGWKTTLFVVQSAPLLERTRRRLNALWPLVEVFPDRFTNIGNTEGLLCVVFLANHLGLPRKQLDGITSR